ncbi:MAG TPA: biotin/lipoyl-binding protein [Blastocatellia bacterium]|nr:biotin/lipoyl-binding protein [Blastocatellia bacterium]HMV87079.1 biotin/lipoyl-binding protein [Blastocatellia bacterium]HMX24517.1 biotin/lipoyl-binding protein [Blastocatellia bacterium]HMZ17347.1 biotin/lipoyl-binding protein [Blastocatellia bacterium]HNG30470.1 biotin/lipoyl-binding protein [Blastocatellia bacterium]
MKLELELNGQTIAAEFTAANGSAQLKLSEQTHEAAVSQPEPGFYVVQLNNRVYRCALETAPGGGTEVVVNGQRIPVAVHDKKRRRDSAAGGAGATGRVNLISPMPGKVVRVLLGTGDDVAANQGVLIVEAMKMQNEVLSPKAGKVAEIRVAEGQTVNAGETLAVIE